MKEKLQVQLQQAVAKLDEAGSLLVASLCSNVYIQKGINKDHSL